MRDRTDEIQELLVKYLKDELTPDEKQQLNEWINQSEQNRLFFEEISNEDALNAGIKDYYSIRSEFDERRLSGQRARVVKLYAKPNNYFRYMMAASAILILAAGFFFYLNQNEKKQAVAKTHVAEVDSAVTDIPPGSNKARLTLADGSVIVLDNAQDGVVAQQGDRAINKIRDGELVYDTALWQGDAKRLPVTYNTISTPRGGKYQLMLPDGSKVWLNAASSLRFPTVFTGEERNVELSGEAYFEIKPLLATSSTGGVRRKTPFIVDMRPSTGTDGDRSGGGRVEVLGTHFNVQAYEEETDTKVTLLEGSVRISAIGSRQSAYDKAAADKSAILKPGEQVSISHASQLSQPIPVQTESAIAWVHGRFSFEKTNLVTVMRELARWYDVQVQYEGNMPAKIITGDVYRNISLSKLLQYLSEMTDLHFEMEGRTVKVMTTKK